jgi:dolichyl-diphosphooligosaccharide--protein glycosyltransferase
LRQWRAKAVYYPLAIAGIGIITALAMFLINSSFFLTILQAFDIFTPGSAARTINEVKPLLFASGHFSLGYPWIQFNTGFFLGLISLVALIILTIKKGETSKVLLIVWSLFLLALTLAQVRFAYYFAVNVALLTGTPPGKYCVTSSSINWSKKKTSYKRKRLRKRLHAKSPGRKAPVPPGAICSQPAVF